MSELRDGGSITIREANREDEQRLRAIAFTAKATWGYDRDRVRAWAETLQLFGETAPTAEIYLAETAGLAIAWMRLVPGNESCVLEDLWVEPISQRAGLGTKLFRFAERRAWQLDLPRLEWEAEPNAIGFYERMGGRHIRDTPRNEWGRTLPVMAVFPLAGELRDPSRYLPWLARELMRVPSSSRKGWLGISCMGSTAPDIPMLTRSRPSTSWPK